MNWDMLLPVVVSLAFMASLAAPGVRLLAIAALQLRRSERWIYGSMLGIVVGSLALLAVSTVAGLTTTTVVGVGIASLLVAAFAWQVQGGRLDPARLRGSPVRRPVGEAIVSALGRAATTLGVLSCLVLVGLAIRLTWFWTGALSLEPTGLVAGSVNIWGDWPVHLGAVASFAFGDNFPPEHPRFSGGPFAYHYLADLTAAAFVKLGMDTSGALLLHSAVMTLVVLAATWVFARRMTADRDAAGLAVLLFFVGGSLAWLVPLAQANAAADPIAAFVAHPWDNGARGTAGFRWENVFIGFLAPQRAFLYGLPLGMLVVTLLMGAVRGVSPGWVMVRRLLDRGTDGRSATGAMTRGRDPELERLAPDTDRLRRWFARIPRRFWMFALAGLVAGLLPLAHLPTMLALAVVTPFLVLAFPSLGWTGFFVTWMAVAIPQLVMQQGGAPGALAHLRVQLGWIGNQEPFPAMWLVFWAKNLGWFGPLVLLALAGRRMMPRMPRAFLLAFGAIFLVANAVVFQPWDWDNHKMLIWWFLAVAILVAPLLVHTWRDHQSAVVRILVVGVLVTMIGSGFLQDLDQAMGHDRHEMVNADEIRLAELVRERTPEHALFAVGLQVNHPIPMLAGRRVLMGYVGWLWTEGIDYTQREVDLRAMYALGPEAARLFSRYGVSYLVIGPYERDQLGANETEFRIRYPIVVETDQYVVFDVRTPS